MNTKKNILLIGVGGTGSNAVDLFFRKYQELNGEKNSVNNVSALVFDTDAGSLNKIHYARTIPMCDNASLGTVCDHIGREYLREWFLCDDKGIRSQEMSNGASQWRKKSYLAFLNVMHKEECRATFHSALENMVKSAEGKCEIYVAASIAGGTGSGSFIPIALYAKRYLREKMGISPNVYAMVTLPDIYESKVTEDNKIKIYANAYAIMRELNAINQVANDYNSADRRDQAAPIRFRIGHPEEPHVGVLFDSADEHYWSHGARPFDRVFLMDKIARVDSVEAHDIVLANSLYTMLCTEIGVAFDSVSSNTAAKQDQNNAHNAIYASAATSQIIFPEQSVLNYLACMKTKEACGEDWLTIHRSVTNAIDDKLQRAQAMHQKLQMSTLDYAQMYLSKAEEQRGDNNYSIIDLLERGVDRFAQDGKPIDEAKEGNRGKVYLTEYVDKYVDGCIPPIEKEMKAINRAFISRKASLFNRDVDADECVAPEGATKGRLGEVAKKMYDTVLLPYYEECVGAMKVACSNAADRFLSLDPKKQGIIGEQSSLLHRLLMAEDGKSYVHPVATMLRLCQIRAAIGQVKYEVPEELNLRHVNTLSDRLLEEVSPKLPASVRNSQYAEISKQARFSLLISKDMAALSAYNQSRTDLDDDFTVLKADVISLLAGISGHTKDSIKDCVYSALARDVDILIEKYRAFFDDFEEELEELNELIKDAYGKDSGNVNSIVNVCSTKEHKEMLLARLNERNDAMTEAGIQRIDHIAGKGVFERIFSDAVRDYAIKAKYTNVPQINKSSIFNEMIAQFREEISSSPDYRKISESNAIEAIVLSCDTNATQKEIDDALSAVFKETVRLAAPPILQQNVPDEDDIVTPDEFSVFLLSTDVARYIKMHAERFQINVPASDADEEALLKAYAEAFLAKYGGDPATKVALVDTIPDKMIYCTGILSELSPLRVAKFDEMSRTNSYFTNYCKALENSKKYESDMWNPHLGFDLHLRANMPYMNPRMEQECDDKVAKAILYALKEKKIAYSYGVGDMIHIGAFKKGTQTLYNKQMAPIDVGNIAHLLTWLRSQDELVEDWSTAYDRDLDNQMRKLPTVVGQSDATELKTQLTKSNFMQMLNHELYSMPRSAKPISAFEFVYKIKVTEENDRDCNDAERILRVLYQSFRKMIEHRTAPKQKTDIFVNVYLQQLKNFYIAVANSAPVTVERDKATQFQDIVNWLNNAGFFLSLDLNLLFHANGELRIQEAFTFEMFNTKTYEAFAMLDKPETGASAASAVPVDPNASAAPAVPVDPNASAAPAVPADPNASAAPVVPADPNASETPETPAQ